MAQAKRARDVARCRNAKNETDRQKERYRGEDEGEKQDMYMREQRCRCDRMLSER